VDPGETCDDGNNVSGDCCSATCQVEFPASCDDGDPCDGADACTPAGTCQPAIDFSCDSAAAKTALTVDTGKGTASSSWPKGDDEIADLGNPTTEDTDYFLCVSDDDSPLVLAFEIDGGLTCGTKPCWKATKNGFAYKSKAPFTASGTLNAGSSGKG